MRLDLERNFRIMREKSTSGFAEKIRESHFQAQSVLQRRQRNTLMYPGAGEDYLARTIHNINFC